MSNPLSEKQQSKKATQRQKILTLWCSQLLLLLISVFALWWINKTTALSVLVGGLIYWVPNAYFTLYAFRFRGAQAAMLILRSMVRGELGKLLLTVIGFALAFVMVKPLDIISLFAAYIGMTLSQWYLVNRW